MRKAQAFTHPSPTRFLRGSTSAGLRRLAALPGADSSAEGSFLVLALLAAAALASARSFSASILTPSTAPTVLFGVCGQRPLEIGFIPITGSLTHSRRNFGNLRTVGMPVMLLRTSVTVDVM